MQTHTLQNLHQYSHQYSCFISSSCRNVGILDSLAKTNENLRLGMVQNQQNIEKMIKNNKNTTNNKDTVNSKQILELARAKKISEASVKQELNFPYTFDHQGPDKRINACIFWGHADEHVNGNRDDKTYCHAMIQEVTMGFKGAAKKKWDNRLDKTRMDNWNVFKVWFFTNFEVYNVLSKFQQRCLDWTQFDKQSIEEALESYLLLKKQYDSAFKLSTDDEKAQHTLTDRGHADCIFRGLNENIRARLKEKYENGVWKYHQSVKDIKDSLLNLVAFDREYQQRMTKPYKSKRSKYNPTIGAPIAKNVNVAQKHQKHQTPRKHNRPKKQKQKEHQVNAIDKRSYYTDKYRESKRKGDKQNKQKRTPKKRKYETPKTKYGKGTKYYLSPQYKRFLKSATLDQLFKPVICYDCKLGGHYQKTCLYLDKVRKGVKQKLHELYLKQKAHNVNVIQDTQNNQQETNKDSTDNDSHTVNVVQQESTRNQLISHINTGVSPTTSGNTNSNSHSTSKDKDYYMSNTSS